MLFRSEGSSARNVNSGKGHGWSEIVIPGIIVDNNKLTIGFTNDKYLTGDSFDGHWFSTDDFGLKYKSADYLDIEETESEDSSIKVYVENGIIKVLTDSPYTIYEARGYKINSAGDNPASFYIVRTINESVKVVVP